MNKNKIESKTTSKDMADFLGKQLMNFYYEENKKESTSEKLLIKKTIQFIKMGANLKFYTPHFNFLENAISNNFNALAKLLIDNGVKLDPSTYTSISPLYLACIKGNYEIVRILCQLDVAKNYLNYTTYPIIIGMLKSDAIVTNQNLIIKNLIESGYNFTKEKDLSNCTPLFYAANQANEELVQLLLENGINPLIKSYQYEKTAYDIAITKNLSIANLIEKYEHIWEEKLRKEEEKEAYYNNMFEEVMEEIKAKVKEKNEQTVDEKTIKAIEKE